MCGRGNSSAGRSPRSRRSHSRSPTSPSRAARCTWRPCPRAGGWTPAGTPRTTPRWRRTGSRRRRPRRCGPATTCTAAPAWTSATRCTGTPRWSRTWSAWSAAPTTGSAASAPGSREAAVFLDLTERQLALRDELRSYFAGLISPAERTAMLTERHGTVYREVVRRMGSDGWLGVGWPAEYGGRGFGQIEQQIFASEAARADVPLPSVTLQTVGPTLQQYGTAEQKARFLPRILAGEVHFAIGYTEPGAGTDLGFSWTPIITCDGAHHVNATYYTDVRVPAGMRVGAENQGWRLVTTQLNHERVMLGPAGRLGALYDRVRAWARAARGPDGGPVASQGDVRRALAE